MIQWHIMSNFSKKTIVIAIVAIPIILGLAGCLRVTADELYSLPLVSEEYLRLQAHINAVLNEGAEFAPPSGGPNRQAVQLKDLSGDGTNEVLAFFSYPGERMHKVYIFEMVDGDYTVAGIIEGVGTAIESVRYADMDGDGVMEVIIGWQMGAALKYFTIYSVKDFRPVLLAREEYNELAVFDLDGDGNEDVIALRLPTQDIGAVAELFVLMPDGEIVNSVARLSNGIDAISRVLTGLLTDGVPAIFIDSEGRFDEGSLVTDVLAVRNGELANISLRDPSGVSEDTVRLRLHSSDISKDGIIIIPIQRLLKAQSETAYHAIDWYAYNVEGVIRLSLTTYHNNFDEWYLILPFDWRGRVSVRREDVVSGERTVIFSYIAGDEGPYEDFLKIYRMFGEAGADRARLPGRTALTSEGTSIYAFELIAQPNSFGLTFDEALIIENFRLIYSDWLAGTN